MDTTSNPLQSQSHFRYSTCLFHFGPSIKRDTDTSNPLQRNSDLDHNERELEKKNYYVSVSLI